jgi:nanoRNase/pAp phosphatase (c-di-AMP/oligoRNAs hydrolase)
VRKITRVLERLKNIERNERCNSLTASVGITIQTLIFQTSKERTPTMFKLKAEVVYRNRLVPCGCGCVYNVRDTSRQGKFLKILRIEIENYSHQHDNGNKINRTSMGINLFNTNL